LSLPKDENGNDQKAENDDPSKAQEKADNAP